MRQWRFLRSILHAGRLMWQHRGQDVALVYLFVPGEDVRDLEQAELVERLGIGAALQLGRMTPEELEERMVGQNGGT